MGAGMAGHLVTGGWKGQGYDLSATALDTFARAIPKGVRILAA